MLWGGGHLLASLASQLNIPQIFSSILVFSLFFISSSFIFSSVIIPITIPNTYATESTDKNTSTSTTDKGYSLSISVPKTVTIDLIPNPNGSFSYSELNTQVTTTNPTGYTLSFNSTTIDPTNPGTTTNPNYTNTLINTNTNITTNNTIPSITNDTNQSDFPTNSWGYSTVDNSTTNVTDATIESLTFKPIPLPSSSTSDKQLKSTTYPTFLNPVTGGSNTVNNNTDNTKLILAIKANNDLASGAYTGQLVFTVLANFVHNTFSNISTMQEMTSAICNTETTPTKDATETTRTHSTNTNLVPEAILRDTRDNNTYVVRKLADGKCWMTQNLRLGTNPDGSAITSPITLNSTDSNIASGTFTLTTSTNDFGSSNTAAIINSVRMHDNGNAYINDDYTNAVQTISTTGIPTSQTNYLGNYYNWYTATAGTGTYEANIGNVTNSICPKGWRLGGTISTSTGNGEFQTLYNIYGLTNDAAGSAKLRQSPISAVLSGGWSGTSANYQGAGGLWWSSSTSGSNYYAYDFVFDISSISLQNNDSKRFGRSVRCVAR